MSMWRLLLCLAWMWETNKSDGFGDDLLEFKVEGCLGSKIIQCEQLHYQVKFHFSRLSAPYWYNGLPCGTWSWPILTMLSLGYQNLISFAKRVVDFDLTYSGNLYSQGAMSFVWVLIFRNYHVWAGWNCAYSWVTNSVAEDLAAVVLTGMLFKFLQLLQNIFCILFFLKVHKSLFFLCLTLLFIHSQVLQVLFQAFHLGEWFHGVFFTVSRCPWILVLLHSNILNQCGSSQILCSPKWKWSIKEEYLTHMGIEQHKHCKQYCNTFSASALIILFSVLLKFSQKSKIFMSIFFWIIT
jgi:hypothetical protein